MRRTIAIACLLVASSCIASADAATDRSKNRQASKPPQARAAVVKPRAPQAPTADNAFDCIRAEAADPSGYYWGHRCWARAALGGTQEP